MIESVLRGALQSGEVAGGTELDDEEMADFTSFLVDGPGSPSPVAENATAEESNWVRHRGRSKWGRIVSAFFVVGNTSVKA